MYTAFNLALFVLSLFFVIKGATLATSYSAKLAASFKLSSYVVGFIIVACISILPETLISINAALAGVPSLGLGTLFGSNVADLTLVFAILILNAGRSIRVESKMLSNVRAYPLLLMLPLLLGLDGYYSRLEGVLMLIMGAAFYVFIFSRNTEPSIAIVPQKRRYKAFVPLLFAMGLLLLGSHFTVVSANALAETFNVAPLLIGLLVISLGTTIPELFFSMQSLRRNGDGLAIGDILGTVLADATIVVGVLALIHPFAFPVKIIYLAGIFMVAASFILFDFMHSGRSISKKEGYALFFFWLLYFVAELVVGS